MSTRAIARREPQQLSDSDEFCHLLSIELNRYSRADWRLTSWVSQPLTPRSQRPPLLQVVTIVTCTMSHPMNVSKSPTSDVSTPLPAVNLGRPALSVAPRRYFCQGEPAMLFRTIRFK
jgi:hypothetical protein